MQNDFTKLTLLKYSPSGRTLFKKINYCYNYLFDSALFLCKSNEWKFNVASSMYLVNVEVHV